MRRFVGRGKHIVDLGGASCYRACVDSDSQRLLTSARILPRSRGEAAGLGESLARIGERVRMKFRTGLSLHSVVSKVDVYVASDETLDRELEGAVFAKVYWRLRNPVGDARDHMERGLRPPRGRR